MYRAYPSVFIILCLYIMIVIFPGYAAAREIDLQREVIKGPLEGALTRVIDGDTVEVKVRIWLGADILTRVRIAGMDAPELHGKCRLERQQAKVAKERLEQLLGSGKITLSNIQSEKYGGRVLAEAFTAQGENIRQYMVSHQLARPYQGKKRQGWCRS